MLLSLKVFLFFGLIGLVGGERWRYAEALSTWQADSVRFLFHGDWGWPGINQTLVGYQMGNWSVNNKAKFLIALGDNFYVNGVVNDTDKQWDTTYRDVYTSKGLQIPWYAILGNHDYHGNPQAQIDYYHNHRDSRWTMPDHVYNAIYAIPNTDDYLEIVFVDTSRISTNETAETRPDGIHAVSRDEVNQELRKVEGFLSRSKARWLFVAGHYTIYSLAEHGDNSELISLLVPMLRKYRVQAYLNGHDHTLQHISWQGVEYFTSGHGCLTDNYPEGHWEYNRSTISRGGFKFGVIGPGFGTAVVSKDTFHMQYVSQDGDILYSALLTNPRTESDLEQMDGSAEDQTANVIIEIVSSICLGLLMGCVIGYIASLKSTHDYLQTLYAKNDLQSNGRNIVATSDLNASKRNGVQYNPVFSIGDDEETAAL